ncbi:transporter substrate-binding domain-containing protein [Stutzerimonas urumqiensis]|uniref:substrate-binding periplasmic protein n=1 Tax=Stutzerimonas urumqiensis TaxID=638269 RepID=UPI000EB23071|nr:transporter substrate-binding domain-containing protein [Stutzerimonas urumqiensis]
MKYLIAALSLLASVSAFARPIVVGVEQASFLPHYSVDEQGRYHGYARDVLDLFAAVEGVELTFRPMPAEALLPALLAGEIDLKYPDNASWASDAKAGHSLHYSLPVADYVDGVLVAPRRLGLGADQLKRLAVVDGWTPRGYEAALSSGQTLLVPGEDIEQMIRQALLKDTDGAYYNVVVATYYLDNIRARPGALVFDPDLPHTRSTYHLSTVRHPELVAAFNRFLSENAASVEQLKTRHGLQVDPAYLGMEQWKVDFLERQKARQAGEPAS